MQRMVITTVGTSFVLNFFNEAVNDALDISTLRDYSDKVKKEPFYAIRDDKEKKRAIARCLSLKDNILKFYKTNTDLEKKASAEIASIYAIGESLIEGVRNEEKEEFSSMELVVHLVCTDTLLSPLCAELVALHFSKIPTIRTNCGAVTVKIKFEEVSNEETIVEKINDESFDSKYIIPELKVIGSGAKQKFETKGLDNLLAAIEHFSEEIPPDKVILNISGGYKALIPFLTIWAQIESNPINYLYEDSQEIIEIKKLPILIDWEIIEPCLGFLKEDFPFKKEYEVVEEFIKTGVFVVQNGNQLSNSTATAQVLEKKTRNESIQELFSRHKIESFDDLSEIRKNHQKYLDLVKLMKRNQLIDEDLRPSAIGRLIKRHENRKPAGKGFLGDLMELFLFYYFHHDPGCDFLKDYQVQPRLILEGKYKVCNDQIVLNNGKNSLGDIDLFLKNKNGIGVLCEVKALGALSDLVEKEYYNRLKARALKYLESHEKVELVFLIYDFQLKGFEKDIEKKIESIEKVKNALAVFRKIREDKQLKDEEGKSRISFNIWGLQKIQPFDQPGAKRSIFELDDDYHIWSKLN